MPPTAGGNPAQEQQQEWEPNNTIENHESNSPPAPAEQDVNHLARYLREASGQALNGDDTLEATSYWDAADMAPLNARSATAIARLRAYRPPPFPVWDRLPASRRAAVLLLLYADRRGDLRIVITMRAASLRSYSGHAAFPGGKADSIQETAYQIARREAWEEIGLPLDNSLPSPFRIEPLCELPCNMARTALIVRPCVAFLHVDGPKNENKNTSESTTTATATTTTTTTNTAGAPQQDAPAANQEEDHDDIAMMPRLDAKEVAAVFTAPFHNFLRATDEPRTGVNRRPLPPGHWYDGWWTSFSGQTWRVHNFYVPVDGQRVSKPDPEPDTETAAKKTAHGIETDTETETPTPPSGEAVGEGEGNAQAQAKLARELGEEERETGRYKVWGMTAHILVDASRIAYDEVPEIDHNEHFGDERLIEGAEREGQLYDKKKQQQPQQEGGEGGEGQTQSQTQAQETDPALSGKRVEPAKM